MLIVRNVQELTVWDGRWWLVCRYLGISSSAWHIVGWAFWCGRILE